MTDLNFVKRQLEEKAYLSLAVLPPEEVKVYTTKVVEEARSLAVRFHHFSTPFTEIEEKLEAFAEQLKESKPEKFSYEEHLKFIKWMFWNEVDNLLP